MLYTGAVAMTTLTSAQRTLNLLAIQKPEVTARLIRQVTGLDAVVVLDLEDSLWDVADHIRTMALKAGARRDLLELANTHPDLFQRFKIGIRLNKTTTSEFSADLAALSEIARELPLSVLIPTKVESAYELLQCKQALDQNDIVYEAIIPIVETGEGIVHFPEIISTAVQIGNPAIIYGHYDYSLSVGLWPFPEFVETSFWDLAEPFIAAVEAAGLSYIHPPLFKMYDDDLFLDVLGLIDRKCRRLWGMLTFGPRQTKLCADFASGHIQAGLVDLRESECLPDDEKIRLAKETLQTYDSHRKENKSFAIDPHTGQFIAAHQYAAALAFLRKAHG
jgi:citrate lyase beta subunit